MPGIFAYLKTTVDTDPRPGKYVLTGSQQFGLLAGITESLAGRAAFLSLLPFACAELKAAGKLPLDPFGAMIQGFYPPLYVRDVSPYDWYTNYIANILTWEVARTML